MSRNRKYNGYKMIASGIQGIFYLAFTSISWLGKILFRLINFIVSGIKKIVKFLISQTKQEYIKFLEEHSFAIKGINEINKKYTFSKVVSHNMENSYDNADFYSEISAEDYLTYQLVYKKNEVLDSIKKAEKNKNLYKEYSSEIKAVKVFDSYDTEEKPKNEKKLKKLERELFEKKIQHPCTKFQLVVKLIQTNINGSYIDHKADLFDAEKITSIITRLNDKNGDFYMDRGIWDSICRVERGKVSNKLRFAVYARDNNRCVKCGRDDVDLEVDHIFPIAKGGKSNFDNLQTLCHRCNALKSDTIEPGVIDPRTAKKKNTAVEKLPICPDCNVPMVLRKGSYGSFYGCKNYPDCKHTERI